MPPHAPERSSRALIPGGSLERDEPENGRRHAHDQDGHRQPEPVALVGDENSESSSSGSPQPATEQLDQFDERVLRVSEGLGAPLLLGEPINVIPLSALDAPHPHSQGPQQPLQPSPIKAETPAPSGAPVGGDHQSPAPPVGQTPPNMIFSDLYKSPRSTFSKFRNPFPHAVPPPSDIDADLVSRDKAKQKEAVKKYLADRIRNDWEFTWPPAVASGSAPAEPTIPAQEEIAQATEAEAADETPVPAAEEEEEEEAPRDSGEEADSESDAESVYSTISEDPMRFRPRAEWTSDLSDNDEPIPGTSPFRFDSPDAVGAAVRDSIETKRTRRRRAIRAEAKWNSGLACFEARRDAWTGAKTVRVKPKPPSPVTPSSGRRLSFWRHHRTQSSASHSGAVSSGSPPGPLSPLQPTATRTSTTTASLSDSAKSGTVAVQRTSSQDSTSPPVLYPVQTVIPIPPPLLPPQNPMRASVQPSMYGSLYDKVVVQSLQPSCPVNLSDMLRACVVGWKRDGEWPPRSSYPAPPPVQTPSADVIAARQRKAQQQKQKQQQQQQQKEQQRRNSAASPADPAPTHSRRLSLVGLFTGGSGVNKSIVPPPQSQTQAQAQHQQQQDKDKKGQDAAKHHRSNSHSDEGGAGSSGKALFRRSLQKVLSLGQHPHPHQVQHQGQNGNANAPLSPTSPTTKEVTAAG
ncbi:hypothetical protein VTI74DRAFT_6607 [Chaetomium olivicolor]